MPRILVTGGCGFLGSHVCELFYNKGWDVVAYDNFTKFEYSRAGFGEGVREYNTKFLMGLGIDLVHADIQNRTTIGQHVKECDFVAHCAAQPAMTIAIENPQLDFFANVLGTFNVLEACRQHNVPMVNCSSIHVYGNAINDQLRIGFKRVYYPCSVAEEHSLLKGKISPLHASKRAAELYVQSYIDMYDLSLATFRLTGIYGPRQFGGEDHGWVANFAIRTVMGEDIKIFGTDKQVRDILYVTDAAQAFYDWYTEGARPQGTFNIGGGEGTSTSIGELLDALERITGKRSKTERLPKREGDLWWFISDTAKARRTFGWSAEVSVDDGLKALVDWIEQERDLFV